MHGTSPVAEEKKGILAEERKEEKDSKMVTVSMVKGGYKEPLMKMKQQFGLDLTSPFLLLNVIAEVAGKTFKMWLGNILEEEHKCWLEMIPHVMAKYHDMP